jgi:photosystem II stability/assembly factor-like uncharacterized protein
MRASAAWVTLVLTSAASAQRTGPRLESQTSGTTARLQAIAIVSPTVVWASGARGTYVRTTDGGKTWHAAVVPGADSLEFRDLHATSADRALLLSIGTGDKSRIYRTIDGGKSWTVVWQNTDPNAFYDCLDFQGDVGVALSDASGGTFPIQQTVDGGRTWKPFAPPGYEQIRAIDGEGAFAASGTCVLIRPDGSVMFGTAKGGRVIRIGPSKSEVVETPIVHGDMAGIATMAFRYGGVGVAAGGDLARADAATDNVIVTKDGGKTWTLGGRPPFPGAIFGVAYVPGRQRTIVAVSPKGSAWSADDGSSWKPLDGQSHWSVAFGADGAGWMVGPEGRITKIRFE